MMSSTLSTNSLQTAYIGAASPTPLGPVWIALSSKGVVAVMIAAEEQDFRRYVNQQGFQRVEIDNTGVSKPVNQLTEYLLGRRHAFDLPVDWSVVTPFQRQVLKLVCAIPYGETDTYGGIASQLGKSQAARAVGQANATNPIPLIIPCHRVIGSDGKMRGYGAHGGIDTKKWLLHLEGWL